MLNVNNGARFTTYVFEGQRGSGIIGVNGVVARMAQPGDEVIICAYGQMEPEHGPRSPACCHPVESGQHDL